jgi:hypothetical protein
LSYLKLSSVFIIVATFFFSCSKEDYEAEIPSYISIDKFTFTTNYEEQGSASENITDAWVFINDDLIGVYELPAKFPVIRKGNVTVKVYAGIKEDGYSANRKRYLPYAPYIKEISLVEEETIYLEPEIAYQASIKFAWIEDFEKVNLTFLYEQDSDTIITKTSEEVNEGNYSGKIFLTPEMNFFEASSEVLNGVPLNGTSPVYLELNYKTNQSVLVGVSLDGQKYSLSQGFSMSSEWKKIYINLTEVIVLNNPRATELKIFFGFLGTPNNPLVTSPEVYIDNLKVVHF